MFINLLNTYIRKDLELKSTKIHCLIQINKNLEKQNQKLLMDQKKLFKTNLNNNNNNDQKSNQNQSTTNLFDNLNQTNSNKNVINTPAVYVNDSIEFNLNKDNENKFKNFDDSKLFNLTIPNEAKFTNTLHPEDFLDSSILYRRYSLCLKKEQNSYQKQKRRLPSPPIHNLNLNTDHNFT